LGSRYRRDAARLRAEIVARVAAGETLRAVCAGEGMPSEHAMRTWARADPGFDRALAAAHGAGAARRIAFDAAKAEAFLAAARAGAPVHAPFGRPGMPKRREPTPPGQVGASAKEAAMRLDPSDALSASEAPGPDPIRPPIPPELPASPDPPDIPIAPMPEPPPDQPAAT